MNKFDTRRIHLLSKPGLHKLWAFGALLMLLACTFFAPPEASCESRLQSGLAHLENTAEAGEPQRWSSFLPIWGEEARKRGYELPLPFGISANFYSEKQDFEVQDLKIAFGDGGFRSIGDFIQLGNIDTRQSNYNLRLDAWLLPFFTPII